MSYNNLSLKTLRQRSGSSISSSPKASHSPAHGVHRGSPFQSPRASRASSARPITGKYPPPACQAMRSLDTDPRPENLDRVKLLLTYFARRLKELSIASTSRRVHFDQAGPLHQRCPQVNLMTQRGDIIERGDPIYIEAITLLWRQHFLEMALSSAGDERRFAAVLHVVLKDLERDGRRERSASPGDTPTSDLARCFEIVDPFAQL